MMKSLSEFPRIHAACLPTPIHRLQRVSDFLNGPDIWIKRDDLTGLAGGGNKTRKLEYILADAVEKHSDTIVTIGGIQSNHTRQVAAMSARIGLPCVLVQEPWVRWSGPSYDRVGNILISRVLGADVRLSDGNLESAALDGTTPALRRTLDELRREGRNPYLIPAGGSEHPLGSLGYVEAADEIIRWEETTGNRFDLILTATSTGSTQAGLIVGLRRRGRNLPVIGVEVDDMPAEITATVKRLSRNTCELLDVDPAGIDDDVQIVTGYAKPSYGVPDEPTLEAIRLMGRLEGLIVDPVYEGRSFAALIKMTKDGLLSQYKNILYMHLGGSPVMHAYADIL